MIRLPLTLGFVLLGTLIGSPIALAQESPKVEPPSQEPITEHSLTDRFNFLVSEFVQGTQAASPAQQDPKAKVQTEKHSVQTPAKLQTRYQTFYAPVHQATSPFVANPFGVSLAEADDALRSQLEIPSGEGVVIVAVSPKGLAHDSGLKSNDVLLSLGDKPAKSVAEVQRVLLALTREAIPVKLIRQGKRTELSVVGPEHGQPAEPTEFWIGVPVSPVDATLRAHLPSLEENTGLVANDVVKESPVEAAGLKKNDILISFAESKPMRTSDDLIAAIQASEGKPSPLTILRAGKPMTLTVTPAKRAKSAAFGVMTSADGRYYRVTTPYSTVVYPFQTNQESLTFTPASPAGATNNSGPAILPPTGFNPTKDQPGQPALYNANASNIAEIYKGMPQDQIHLRLMTNPAQTQLEDKTAKIEAELKAVSTKIDEILKELKKSEKK